MSKSKGKKVAIMAYRNAEGDMDARIAGGDPSMHGWLFESIFSAKETIRTSRGAYPLPKKLATIHEVELISEDDWRTLETLKALLILENASDENLGVLKLITKAFLAGYNLHKEQESKK